MEVDSDPSGSGASSSTTDLDLVLVPQKESRSDPASASHSLEPTNPFLENTDSNKSSDSGTHEQFLFTAPAPVPSLKTVKKSKPQSAEHSSPVPVDKSSEKLGSYENVKDKEVDDQKIQSVKTESDLKSASSKSDPVKSRLPTLSYKEPAWSEVPDDDNYSFDVLKNGKIISSVPLSDKSFHVFGRLPSCDVTLEHPTLSRHHAVMQFSKGDDSYEKGWYIYDLDSTHGTWVNKRKIPPKVYLRVKVGYVLKFGGSTRLHILQGPSDDQEDESELTFTEMKDQRERLKKEADLVKQCVEIQRKAAEQKLLEDTSCSWGMGEDAVEEEVESTPIASLVAENESMYIDDPKKALKGFYEREGCDLPDYQFSEAGFGKHKCTLILPVDGPNGEELVAEATVSGKRKDAVIACALEACRIIDKLGMLRASTHESRKRKQKKWEDNDFYDSDEDTFLDRTGTIEKKRALRMKKAGKEETETYESLMEKYTKVTSEIEEVEEKLAKAKAESEQYQAKEDQDELEAYMNSIKAGAMDPKTKIRLKAELMRLNMEEARLRKLVNIAKPASLPPLKPSIAPVQVPSVDSLARKIHAQQKVVKKTPTVAKQETFEEKPEDFQEEDDEEEESQSSNRRQETKSTAESRLINPENRNATSSRLQPPGDSGDVNRKEKARDKEAPPSVKGPFLPPSMLAELAKGKSSAEAFMAAQKSLTTGSASRSDKMDSENGEPD